MGLYAGIDLHANNSYVALMMRLKLARDNPTLGVEAVEKLLVEWLRKRPGAERGDCPASSRMAR